MQNIKITVAYDGAAFHGWQFQPGDLQTIQGTLQETLRKITQERIMIHGASRTTPASMPSARWRTSKLTRISPRRN